MEDIDDMEGREYEGDLESLVDMILLEDGCSPEYEGMDRAAIREQLEKDIGLLEGVLEGNEKKALSVDTAENAQKNTKNTVNPLKEPRRYCIECVRRRITVVKYPEKPVFQLMQQVFHYRIYLVSSSNPA